MNFNTKIASLGFSCVLALASTQAHAQVLATWNYNAPDAVATNNTPVADIGSGTSDSIGMNIYATPNVGVTKDDVLAGASGDTGANGVADLTQEWRVRGQAGTNGAANGWSSAAPIGTQGAQYFVPTTGITAGQVKLTFDWYDTSAGEAKMQLEYTTNGTTWNNVALTLGGSDGGLQLLTNSSSANTVIGSYVSDTVGQDWFTGLTVTITDAAALNDPNFGVEMVNASTGADDLNAGGTALNNSSGNWRFDNVTVAAVPEPSSWALALIVALAFIGLRRRMSGRSL